MNYLIKIPLVALLLSTFSAMNCLLAQKDIHDFHYEPAEGRYLGIWPNVAMAELDFLKSYKNELGFKYIMLLPNTNSESHSSYYYDLALDAGYSPEEISIKIKDVNYEWASENLGAKNYYLDEPVEHDCFGDPSNDFVSHIYPPSELEEIKSKIKSDDSTAIFTIGGYKRCSHFSIAGDIADQVMYSSYTNWNELGFLFQCSPNLEWGSSIEPGWIPGDDNQSRSWNEMSEIFSSGFQMSWVHGNGDEYEELFDTADSIGLKTLFLYANRLDNDENIRTFCDIAYLKGWLNKTYLYDFNPPYNLLANEIDKGVVTLTWEDSTEYAEGYILEKKAASDTAFYFLDSLSKGEFSFGDSLILQNHTYSYRLYSYTSERNSDFSDTVSITSSVIPIGAPSDLQADVEITVVSLSWQDNSDNESKFYIERKDTFADVFDLIDSTGANVSRHIDSSIVNDGSYHYRITAANEFTTSKPSDTVEVSIFATGVKNLTQDYTLELHQNYPNPFNPVTVIDYSVPAAERGNQLSSQNVKLIVYDILGRHVATLVNQVKKPGMYNVVFNAEKLTSGIYYYSINIGRNSITKKMLLLK